MEAARRADNITIKAMASAAADRLANTPSIARKSYIHPAVIALAEDPDALPDAPDSPAGLRADERRLIALLDR